MMCSLQVGENHPKSRVIATFVAFVRPKFSLRSMFHRVRSGSVTPTGSCDTLHAVGVPEKELKEFVAIVDSYKDMVAAKPDAPMTVAAE